MENIFYLLAAMVALLSALFVGSIVERVITRYVGRRYGWWND